MGEQRAGASSESQCPAAFMSGVVMPAAERHHVVEIGRPAVFPILDVVDLTGVKSNSTSIERTGVMGGFECSPLRC